MRTVLALLALLLLSTVVHADPPFIRTNGMRHDWDRATCLANVKGVMESLGFTDLDVDPDDVEGPKGEYMAEVHCWRRVAFAIVAGPDHDDAGDLRNSILEKLKALR